MGKRGLGIAKLLLAVIWLPLLVWLFREQILGWIHGRPCLSAAYEFAYDAIVGKTLWGAAILQFLSNLFFIMFLPKYLVYAYFVTSGELDHVHLVPCFALGMFGAMCVNYLLGVCFGFLARLLAKGSMEKLDALLSRFGSWLILVGYLFPVGFPCALLSFICGSSHFSVRKFLICTAIGCPAYFTVLSFCEKWILEIYEKANFIL